MSETGQSGRQLGLRLQSALVLPLARGIYTVVALGCLLAVMGGALYLVYLQTSIASHPTTLPVPPPYQADGVALAPRDRVVDLAGIGARLEPPANIRLAVVTPTLHTPPEAGTLIGRFLADTPNALATYPEGVSLLGGRDAELFERVSDGRNQAIGLAARPALVAELTEALSDIKEETRRSFELRVVARDQYGIASAPTDLSFELTLAPKPADAAAPPSASQPELEATELEKIARDIARTVEPEVNPAHFSAYKTALALPERCGSSETDTSFISNFRRAVDEMGPRLTASNVEAFYTGLVRCLGRDPRQRGRRARGLEGGAGGRPAGSRGGAPAGPGGERVAVAGTRGQGLRGQGALGRGPVGDRRGPGDLSLGGPGAGLPGHRRPLTRGAGRHGVAGAPVARREEPRVRLGEPLTP